VRALLRRLRRPSRPTVLHTGDERYRALFDRAPVWIHEIDAAARVTSMNATGLRMLGRTEVDVVGRSYLEVVGEEDRPRVAALLTQALEGRESEFEYTTGGDDPRVYASSFIPICEPDGSVERLLGVTQDVTARRRAEERYRLIVETASEGIWTIDLEGRTTFVNRKLAHLFGLTPEAMIGRPIPDFMDGEARELWKRMAHDRQRGDAGQHDFRFVRSDGSPLWVLMSTGPLFDAAGALAGSLAMVTDLSERRRLEEQLRQAQKMEAVGRLAGGIAHDFNNLLTAIMGYSELALDGLAAEAGQVREDIRSVRDAAERAQGLTQQLLAFSRRQVLQPRVVEPEAVVAGIEAMLRRLIGEDVELVTERAGGGCALVDPGQLEQVLLNLVVNARDAMPRGGRVSIRTRRVDVDERPHVAIEVADTGVGMSDDVRAQVFDPFFTTKDPGKGTGLGLATVYGIVEQSGGHIEVESEPGRGSTFTLLLPAVEDSPAPEPAELGAPPPGRETVLLVEDEESVRALARRVLAAQGYRVLEARDPLEALRICREHGGPIDLLLSDVVMPELGGRELADRVLEQRPGLPLLFMSGYADAVQAAGGLGEGSWFIAKPFRPDELAHKVREVLDAAA
jgi:two-component system cell cycle sensor histidine kinase/response regulator CckA